MSAQFILDYVFIFIYPPIYLPVYHLYIYPSLAEK